MTAPIPTPLSTDVAALPDTVSLNQTGELAQTGVAYRAIKAIVAWINAAKSATDLTTGTLAPARIADGSLPLVKLASLPATKDQLDAVSATATGAAATANSALTAANVVPVLPVKDVTGSYPLIATDPDYLLRSMGSTDSTITLNSTVAVGRSQRGVQYGTGRVTLAGAVGITVVALGNLRTTSGQYAQWEALRVSATEWLVSGEMA